MGCPGFAEFVATLRDGATGTVAFFFGFAWSLATGFDGGVMLGVPPFVLPLVRFVTSFADDVALLAIIGGPWDDLAAIACVFALAISAT